MSHKYCHLYCSMLCLPQPSTRSLQHIYQVQLGRFFQEGEFTQDVREQLLPLVSCAIAIYYRTRETMKPTPSKIHYTFNLRDLSKVLCVFCYSMTANNMAWIWMAGNSRFVPRQRKSHLESRTVRQSFGAWSHACLTWSIMYTARQNRIF